MDTFILVVQIISLVYAVVVALVLAVSLVTILVYLRRVGDSFVRISRLMAVVEDVTRPLNEQLGQVNAALGRVASDLEATSGDLGGEPDAAGSSRSAAA